MSGEMVAKEPEVLTPATITEYICKDADKRDIFIFLQICKSYGLNPFKREIHLVKYAKDKPASIVVGYEVYLKRAERTKHWNGFECGTEGTGDTMKAWVKIYRKDWEHPLYHEVYFDEYKQEKNIWENNKIVRKELNTFWASKPRTMLKKVAMCQGFRLAFPDECGGMPYTPEELNTEVIDTLPVYPTGAGKPEVTEPEAKSDIEQFNGIPSASEEKTPAPSAPTGQSNPPPASTTPAKVNDKGEKLASDKQLSFISNLVQHWKDGSATDKILKDYGVTLFNDLTSKQASEIIKHLQELIAQEKKNGQK